MVDSLKEVSSRRPCQEYDSHIRRHRWDGHIWSGSYFAGSCDGAPLTLVKQCIDNQKRPISPTRRKRRELWCFTPPRQRCASPPPSGVRHCARSEAEHPREGFALPGQPSPTLVRVMA
ncbi:transposase [Streptomyces agglomeratus]|uniref:transposase n=1 Tax=Streptomyces agglomeratus TaxID=285458 RepID=UPI00210F0148|nr:transposase [Streptomyces agglomeratus]